jgi:DNA polymerase
MEMSLKEISDEIKGCRECRRGKEGLPVPGEGPADAKVMFVGMAPGAEESRTGRPFVGRSGKLLTEMLASIGVKRGEAYITSPVKYYPGRRGLRKKEIEHGAMHLRKQIEAVSPRIIVLLGDVAIKALAPEKKLKVTESHGKTFRKGDITYFITFHPSAAMRFPRIRRLMDMDFRKLRAILP